MNTEDMREALLRKSWAELYEIKGGQYTEKEKIVEEIIMADDGSVKEILEMEGSWLDMMAGKGKYEKREDNR